MEVSIKNLLLEKLSKEEVYEVLCQTLPKQNDFTKSDYSEELSELLHFGIDTKLKLLDLIVKHREDVLEIDAEDLDEHHIKWYSEDYGEDYVKHRVENKFWFAYPGLLRITLELEFGEEYVEFSKKRDGT